MTKPFVFDTSSFIRAWHEAYPIDVMHTFWDLLDKAIDAGFVISPEEVLRETSKRSDELHKWLKARQDRCFVEIDEDLEEAVAELLANNERIAMNRKGASSADAWVVALAKIRTGTVISEESMTDSQKRPKIPGVCKEHNVPCVNLLAFMRAQKWRI
ncbi:MAG: DUF4411 family protein [Deltaproteobacteria bacterium]|nr:DUF4411 family protein [Deltaproteobacteria bacterium]